MINPHFLVVSLGNPLPKYDTLHSAGHYVLKGLANALGHAPLRETRLGGLPVCFASNGAKHTLIQSPTLMNTSGKFVADAWRHMYKQRDPHSLSLVLVHDELESADGVVSLLPWARSARGHRGVKDVHARLRQEVFPSSPLARIAIGIGRPEGRDNATVVDYVMSRISASSKRNLEGTIANEAASFLAKLEDYWQAEIADGRRDPGLGWSERMSKDR
ncbi:mitochondrial peptidyl-tRNA hydrolase [Ophiocordyceps camponoti-floridani]|uniref:Mitochondrial peptidyl-tRNA hydrolase n=1 Tax=Ophiocordyceps camponoti-floridani TaxID=2030778 RepID=A0A8H4VGJ6_9HYPO|nr:mitochondrial peptidyl-tRNA hydrolase [Ophiocordyceps camponoti-floridani]